jgi:hypothetical protein
MMNRMKGFFVYHFKVQEWGAEIGAYSFSIHFLMDSIRIYSVKNAPVLTL